MTKKINKTIDLNKILQRHIEIMLWSRVFNGLCTCLIFTCLFHKRTDEKHNTY